MRFAALPLAILIVFALTGCGTYGYGPPVDYSKFVSAMATPDGSTGVFSHHRYVYRPATGWRSFPDGGIPYYAKDDNVLGILDIPTGEVRVVAREKNKYFQNGQGNFFVTHVTGRWAVVSQYGQKRTDYLPDGWWFLLDLDTAELTRLELREDLEKHGRGLAYFYLLSDSTLVFVTPPLGADSNYVHKEANVKELWMRSPDGIYSNVADVIHYYPTIDGLLHFYTPDRRYLVYDPASGQTRTPPGNYPPSIPDATFGLSVSSDDRNRLSTSRKTSDGWVYTDAGVDAGELY